MKDAEEDKVRHQGRRQRKGKDVQWRREKEGGGQNLETQDWKLMYSPAHERKSRSLEKILSCKIQHIFVCCEESQQFPVMQSTFICRAKH